jgi:3'(2'), 5'-bisphosphate nucleotidase
VSHKTPTQISDDDLMALAHLSLRAGREIMHIYADGIDVELKADKSPLTKADLASHKIITDGISERFVHIPLISEEDNKSHLELEGFEGAFFLIDPLDGTKEFINRRPDFTVNIALIENRAPRYGIIYAPVRQALYIGDVVRGRCLYHQGALPPTLSEFQTLFVHTPQDPLKAVASFSHNSFETDAYLEHLGVKDRLNIGSSLKFCLLAQGLADVYPRLSPTMEWDTAAGDAILRAAGGKVVDRQGQALLYAKPRFYNPEFFALGALDFITPKAVNA